MGLLIPAFVMPNESTMASPRIPRRTSHNMWLGSVLMALFCASALVGPWLAPLSPTVGNLDDRLQGPSLRHLLGTDENGVDLLSAMLYGARLSLIVAGSTVVVCAAVGVTWGSLAGYFRGFLDDILMRVVDVLLAFPGILLNLAIIAVAKRPGIGLLIFALAIKGWVGYARIARAQVLSLREREFVSAARAVGATTGRILHRHIFPNLVSPLLVQMTFGFGGVILVEAALSFLGLGPQVSYSWGALLDQGTGQLWHTHWLATIPGMAIALVVLGCNLLGDGLRDRLDPKLEHER